MTEKSILNTFRLFVFTYLVVNFVPRLVVEGMFPDGLTYAAIGRNMAQGVGGFWTPFFAESFWLPYEGASYEFWGHPTLAMWLMSILYRIFGDSWWVEKLFCALVWLAAIWAIRWTWRTAQTDAPSRSMSWLALLLWYATPIVLWSYPYAMLDNLLSVFCFLTVGFGIKLTENKGFDNQFWQILGISTLCFVGALLTKGPIGLFGLAVPFFWSVFMPPPSIGGWSHVREGFLKSAILTISVVGAMGLIYLYPPAQNFFKHYFQEQILGSINAPNEGSGDRFDLIPIVRKELIPASIVLILFLIFTKFKPKKTSENTRKVWFWLCVFGAATLPMLVSRKLSANYVVPSMPYAALALAQFMLPSMQAGLERISPHSRVLLGFHRFFVVVLLGLVVYSAAIWGKTMVGREPELISDMKILRQHIPPRAYVRVCEPMMKDFCIHAYFQRYHFWQLTYDTTRTQFAIARNGCAAAYLQDSLKNFEEIKIPTSEYRLFEKKK